MRHSTLATGLTVVAAVTVAGPLSALAWRTVFTIERQEDWAGVLLGLGITSRGSGS